MPRFLGRHRTLQHFRRLPQLSTESTPSLTHPFSLPLKGYTMLWCLNPRCRWHTCWCMVRLYHKHQNVELWMICIWYATRIRNQACKTAKFWWFRNLLDYIQDWYLISQQTSRLGHLPHHQGSESIVRTNLIIHYTDIFLSCWIYPYWKVYLWSKISQEDGCLLGCCSM